MSKNDLIYTLSFLPNLFLTYLSYVTLLWSERSFPGSTQWYALCRMNTRKIVILHISGDRWKEAVILVAPGITYLLSFYCVLKHGNYKEKHSIVSSFKQTWAYMYGTQTVPNIEMHVVLRKTIQFLEISPIQVSHLFIVETSTSIHHTFIIVYEAPNYNYPFAQSVFTKELQTSDWRYPIFLTSVPSAPSEMTVTLQLFNKCLWKWNGVKSGKATNLRDYFNIITFCIWRLSLKRLFLILPFALWSQPKTLVREKLLKSVTSLAVSGKEKSKQTKLIVNTLLLLKHLVAMLGQAKKRVQVGDLGSAKVACTLLDQQTSRAMNRRLKYVSELPMRGMPTSRGLVAHAK